MQAGLNGRLGPLELPTLHIMGTEDKLVPNESSEAVARFFASAQMVKHDGGHVVPSAVHVRSAFKDFVAATTLGHPVQEASSTAASTTGSTVPTGVFGAGIDDEQEQEQ